MMKRSNNVALILLPAFAVMFMAACDDGPTEEHTRACLDPQGKVVPVRDCEDMYNHSGIVNGHPSWFYYWYYMRGNNSYPVGSRVAVMPGRGSFSAPEGASFAGGSSVGVARGGFGATGHASAGE